MAKNCNECDERESCTKLCKEAKAYANQDWRRKNWRERYSRTGTTWEFDKHAFEAGVSMKELFGGVPYLELPEWTIIQRVKLTEQQSQCLWLYSWEELRQHEIATKLKISQVAISKHIDAAKEKVAFYLKERQELLDKIERAQLTDKQKRIAELYHRLGYTQKETAKELNKTQQAIGKSLKIIKRKIENN